jgi:hypothetical protein
VKKTRTLQGKGKITWWDKMKKHMRSAFLPYNYTRTLYQRLQNLRQGNRSVDEYTTDFYQLVSRDAIAEDEESRVARYIGGLRIQFQDFLNMFDVLNVSDAHQRAVQLEKQQVRRNTGGMNFGGSGAGTSNNSGRTGSMSFGGSGTGGASSSSSRRATIPPSTITKPTTPTHTQRYRPQVFVVLIAENQGTDSQSVRKDRGGDYFWTSKKTSGSKKVMLRQNQFMTRRSD